MDILQKTYRMHRLLGGRRHPVSMKALQDELECSRSTVKRIIEELRLYFNAPIEYDRKRNGYFYDLKEGDRFELPGLWFSPEEMLSLLTVQHLLGQARPGLLDSQLAPFRLRIESILEAEHLGSGEIAKRVRILRMAGREISPRVFQTVSAALLQRKRLLVRYASRGQDEKSERTLSPQRLTHYRDNWYLDAYCHLRGALRSFSVECIEEASLLEGLSTDIPESELDAHFASSYGIFAGKPVHVAKLIFTPERARWVCAETWHPEQKGMFLEDGSYALEIPYSDSRELVMDIMKYGPDVHVIGPESLRQEVKSRLLTAIEKY